MRRASTSRPMPTPRSYDVFLTLNHAGGEAEELVPLCAAMQVNTAHARLLGVDLYYRAETDVMILALRFDANAATGTLLQRVYEDAEKIGALVIEAARLPEEDRRRFYDEHLTSYPLHIPGLPTPGDAMAVLAMDLGHGLTDAMAKGSRPRSVAAAARPKLEVHYARGDEWQLGRARNLTREGVYVVAGGTPRRDDIVEVRLSAGDIAFTARGQVVYVTPDEVANALGASGFGVRFLLSAADDRQRLETIVTATLGEGQASVRPAPARRDVRYPVRWPVAVDVGHTTASLSALDISLRGMFVACAAAQLPSTVDVAFGVDDPGEKIRAIARVARWVPPPIAVARGTVTGFGLELGGFSPSDEARFHMFVTRVGRRSERSVLVVASPDRVGPLAAELLAAGYPASSVSDPDAVVSRAGLPRPPDLIVVDESFEAHGGGSAVRAMRRALARRDVAVCFLEGAQAPVAARALIDAALLC